MRLNYAGSDVRAAAALVRRDGLRILLAAVHAPKGDLDGNLARHLAVLDQARAQGCHLAVFPEFSLTGSVDPRRHPERALTLDAGPVRALVDATWRTGVAAVFGIAERAGPAFHITQVYAHSGRLGGVYRKRHLGEGEEGYRTGTDPGVFRLGAARFGVTVCAEGGVDFPWDDAAAGGAAVVLFCSAPGLYGRRTDERGWRDGHAWWLSCGLGDALGHARRLGVPVAMATQAGATEDEDFPGLAALVTRPARWPGCPTGGRAAWSWTWPPTSPSTRSARPSAAWSSTTPAGPCWSATPTTGSRPAGGACPAGEWTRARTTWPPSAGSCARSWPATTSGSAPSSAAGTTPSGWDGG
jgi:predicted amidohydrolase